MTTTTTRTGLNPGFVKQTNEREEYIMSIRQQAREALEDIQNQAERVWKCDKKVLRRSMRVLAHIVNQYCNDSDKAIVQSYFDSIAKFQSIRRVIIKNA